jgi:hypothetical protein
MVAYFVMLDVSQESGAVSREAAGRRAAARHSVSQQGADLLLTDGSGGCSGSAAVPLLMRWHDHGVCRPPRNAT